VGKVLAQRFPNDLRSGGLALAVAVSLAAKKKVSVVNVVRCLLLQSQSCTSLKIFACGSRRPTTLTWSAMSRKLCSNRAALLACTQNTHVSDDRSRVR
jgi:hypothetical protein